MSVLADDDVVVHRYSKWIGDADDRLRHLDVGLRGRRIAAGMVVHEDHGGCGQFQRPLDDLARLNRGVIDRAGLLYLVGDQLVALVEKENAKLFFLGESHAGATVADDVVPRRQRDTPLDLALGDAAGSGSQQPELGDRGIANAVDFAKQMFRCVNHLGK